MKKIILFLLFLCSTSTTHADSPQLRIGVISALSGGMATIGTAVRNGIELARKDHPELFEHISFAYEDDQFDAKQGISAYRNLKNTKKADLILGFGGILAHAIGQTIEHDKTPLINFNFEAKPAVGRPHIIRAMNHTDQYMEALANYLAAHGKGELPYLQTEATFLGAMVKSLVLSLGERRILREVAKVNTKDLDFRPFILKLRSSKASEVGLFLWPDQLLAFLKQAKELGFQPKYFGTDLCETAAALDGGKELLEGCLYPDNEVSVDFRKRYRDAYGDEAQLTFAGSAYDMAILVGELVKGQSQFNEAQFLKDAAKVSSHPGVLGVYSFRETQKEGKFFEYPVVIKRIVESRGVPVQTQ